MDGKLIVLITGANQGVGYEAARDLVLSSEKYHVLMGSRDLSKGTQAVSELQSQEIKGTVEPIQLDVDDDSSVEAAVQTVTEKHGHLDVLVNNAGINYWKDTPLGNLRRMLATNVTGAFSVTEAFTPLLLRSKDARLIFVSSSMGSISHAADPSSQYYRGKPTNDDPRTVRLATEYRISKAALNMMIVQYNKLLKDKGVKVHGADPGVVVTNFFDKELARKMGAPEADVGGRTVSEVVKGLRDDDMGRVCGRYGVSPW